MHEQKRGKWLDLAIDYQELVPARPPEMDDQDGKLYERVHGSYIPRRLRFSGVQAFHTHGSYQDLSKLEPQHPAREVHDLLHWIPAGERYPFYVLFGGGAEEDELSFAARSVSGEAREGEARPVLLERDWCSPPPTRAGIVPSPGKLYERYGGDPIRIRLGHRPYDRRLFTGGVEVQPRRRPEVDWVLNLGEIPSRWVTRQPPPPYDRWENKGEGVEGMSLDEIREEANWVIERLRDHESVLVHCAAGMNRSATICCAALILLEGLPAEEALERVRQHHPWARPDGHHWLKLRWLGMAKDMPGR
jgi:hypothetical protein